MIFSKFSKILAGVVLMLAMAVCLISTDAKADPCTCLSWQWEPVFNTYFCMAWQPLLIPGATWCAGDPDTNHVNIYTGTNYTGWCQTLPIGVNVSDAAAVGWNFTENQQVSATMKISSVKVGYATRLWTWEQANYSVSDGAIYGRNPMKSVPDTTNLTIESFQVQANH